MTKIEKYKNQYGDENLYFEGEKLVIPDWLVHYILDVNGIKSKKTRIQKKIIKKAIYSMVEETIKRYEKQ